MDEQISKEGGREDGEGEQEWLRKPTKILESSISGLSVSLDNCDVIGHIQRPGSHFDQVNAGYPNFSQLKGLFFRINNHIKEHPEILILKKHFF